MSTNSNTYALKYRPQLLSQVIGHEQHVTRLKGMVASNKLPNALLFTGPSSVGKTTLARCLAAEVNGVNSSSELKGDYSEINASDNRSIDDIRELIRTSRFRPTRNKRIIVIDEAQGLLSNAAAAAALLKPLEEPSPNTVWVLCSMDPSKFKSVGNGKAIANRCSQFSLEPHSDADLTKQAIRIIKGESLRYLIDSEKAMVKAVVEASNNEMRTLANVLQSLNQYYEGLADKPKRLTPALIQKVLDTVASDDTEQIVNILSAVYSGQYKSVIESVLDIQDPFRLIQGLVYANQFMLYKSAVGKHRKVWWTNTNKALDNKCKTVKPSIGMLAATHECLINLKAESMAFSMPAEDLILARLYRLIKEQSK